MSAVRVIFVVMLLLVGLSGSPAFRATGGQATGVEASLQDHCPSAEPSPAHPDGCGAARCMTAAHCAFCAAILPPPAVPARAAAPAPLDPPSLLRLAEGRAVDPANEPPRRG